MATDQEFIKKEYSHLTTFEKIMVWFVPITSILIAIIATLLLFVLKPDEPCDLDKASAWCRVHPFTGWDILGVIFFYWGALWLGSILPRLFIVFGWLDDDSSKFPMLNFLGLLASIGGFLLMYMV